MNPAFHYVVKAKLIRYKNADDINFLEFEEKFENENPIIAREAAFNFYQNYIDVLLESKNIKYISDKQTREELKTFIETETSSKMKVGDKLVEFNDAFGNGIGIFLVVDIAQDGSHESLSYKKGDEFLIHGIGHLIGGSDNPDYVVGNLDQEHEFYQINNYDTKNKEKKIVYCSRDEWEEGFREDEPSNYIILETPFDWTGFEKPYWWGEPDKSKQEIQQVTKSVEQIIEGGEGNQVEFKPSLLYNFKSNKAGISVKGKIATTVCAFLNSNGGYLLIGVKNDKTIGGLSYDFSLSNEKDQKDFFLLEFDEMIEQFISTSIINYVKGEFYEIEGKEIFLVSVQPSNRRPIFLKGQEGKEFFVRKLASSKRIYDIEEIANYCIDKWSS